MRTLGPLVVFPAVIVACGTPSSTTTCDQSNCTGCCSASGQCVDGTANALCGGGGNQCDVCGAGDVCRDQRCTTTAARPAADGGGNPDVPDAGHRFDAPLETWTWVDFPDAVCGNGAPTGIGVNLTDRSNDLLVFLMGGGACWNAATCSFAATDVDDGYGAADFKSEGTLNAPPFDRTIASNPFKNMSFVFVPYCTGDVHGGNVVQVYGSGTTARTLHHKGGKNAEIFLQGLHDALPQTSRVFLSGSSAGAFGAQLQYENAARIWSGTEVHVIADCGQMINPTDGLLTTWREAWAMPIPSACAGCDADFTKFPKYLHDKYPSARFGLLAYAHDGVLTPFFFLDPGTFKERTLALTASAYDATNNAKYFLASGSSHVMLDELMTLQGPGGAPLVDWVQHLVDGDPAWQSIKP
jgi:hypothetical protein